MENSKDKKLIITPLDESTKKISQVLANDTCRVILDVVSSEALSSSQISEKLKMPLTTIDYNVKKLAEVGLITIHHRKWSSKGKKVNYYAPAEKFILIAPKAPTAQIFKTLKTLLPVVLGLAVISGVLEFAFAGFRRAFSAKASFLAETAVSQVAVGRSGNISGNVTTTVSTITKAGTPPLDGVAGGAGGVAVSEPVSYAAPKVPFLLQHPGLIIFIIGIAVILLYVIYKYKYEK